MADPNRADPFAGDLDLSDFKSAALRKPAVAKEALREISEQNNFPSRAAERPAKAQPKAQPQRGGARVATSSSTSRRHPRRPHGSRR